MSRPASDYTLAIRKFLDDSNGAVTHSEARPMLQSLGFEIAAEPGPKSDAFSAFEKYEFELDNPASIAGVIKACKFDEKTAKVVVKEAKLRAAFQSERNNFDVTKHQWSKRRESGQTTPSRKPTGSKNTKAHAAAATGRRAGTIKPQPKHRRGMTSVVASTDSDSLALVKANGGVAASQEKIEKLRADAQTMLEEAASLGEAVAAVQELEKLIKEAA